MSGPAAPGSGRLRAAGILGVGAFVPERVVTNGDLERTIDTSDEWIRQRTGIQERRIVAEGEACSDIATRAAEAALADARCDPKEVDLIIVGTVSGDYLFPSTATLVQGRIGATNAAAFDLSAACPGFIYGASVGTQFIATGRYRRVLVVGAEVLSRLVDWTDRGTCILFGDGAGAAVLAPLEEAGRGEVLETNLFARGGQPELLWYPAGLSRNPTSQATLDAKLHRIMMAGREVYRVAVDVMVQMVGNAIAKYGKDEIALVIPHQMNRRILESVIDKLELDPARVLINIEKYGNTSAGSIPVALNEAAKEGRLVKGKVAVLCAVGAGFTWGSMVLRW